jgi:L-alanine-DL-glutamate epimerase-like enolase superfamily enzyme
MHDPDIEKDLSDIREIVKTYGGQIRFMVDANQADHLPGADDIHCAWDAYTALRVARALEELNMLWLEEPLAALISMALPWSRAKRISRWPAAKRTPA